MASALLTAAIVIGAGLALIDLVPKLLRRLILAATDRGHRS